MVQQRSGIHHLQEDHPELIGSHVKDWLIELGVCSRRKQKPVGKMSLVRSCHFNPWAR